MAMACDFDRFLKRCDGEERRRGWKFDKSKLVKHASECQELVIRAMN
jgi:hypothetical protein